MSNEKLDGEAEPILHPEKVISKQDSPKPDNVGIQETPILALPTLTNEGGAVGFNGEMSPVMNEMNGIESQIEQGIEPFEEIPVEVCGQLYSTALELGYALKHKGSTPHPIPEQRVKTQAEILYGILKKNQMSIAHIDLFMFAAGMLGDWKVMNTTVGDITKSKPGSPEYKAAYGEITSTGED